jgi:hypothetical protein
MNGASELCSGFLNMWHSRVPHPYQQFCLLTYPQRRECAVLHIISIWRAPVSASKICMNCLQPIKYLPLRKLSSCATVWNCTTCKGQRHKIWPCHCSTFVTGEFWKSLHSIGAPFINPSTQLHLKLFPNCTTVITDHYCTETSYDCLTTKTRAEFFVYELQKILEGYVHGLLMVLSWCLGQIRKTTKDLIQNSYWLRWDSKHASIQCQCNGISTR